MALDVAHEGGASEEMIGCITLMKREENNRGFWMGIPWQGRGLMTEACEAATDYWFNELRFPVLRLRKRLPTQRHAESRRKPECEWSRSWSGTTFADAFPPSYGR